MDNILEKFTLYDFVGYTLPGAILSLLLGRGIVLQAYYKGVLETYTIYFVIIILVIGYCLGVAIDGTIELICSLFRKIINNYTSTTSTSSAGLFENNELEEIGYKAITRALQNTKIVDKTESLNSSEEVMKYIGYMYGEVQVDEKYKRLHNYSSMQLFCSNMVVVCIVISYVLVVEKLLDYCLLGIALAVIFGLRAQFFYKRKLFYTIAWFVENNK